MKVFFAGGGTAGHLYAGIALADRLKQIHPNASICFFGARGGMEERLVPKAGYSLRLVAIGAWNGSSLLRRAKTAVQLPWACLRALFWLLSARPELVIGVGGYASFPVVGMAGLTSWLWRGRVVVLEQNVLPGLTNRILGRLASRVFAAFPGAEGVFSEGKVVVTGNPIRSSMRRVPPAQGEVFTVFVFGGSQGAIGINSLVIEAIEALAVRNAPDRQRLRWIHQTGEKDFERVRAAHERFSTGARVEKFIYDMPDCYAQSSLLICRAGSSTLAEVATVGRAAILIPLVSADRHQEFNAQLFAEAGAAEIRLQKQTNGAQLADLILALANDRGRVEAMENKVTQFARPDAIDRIFADLFPSANEKERA
ncbi:MAG: undecaprenyldiphospho-muramoylpentapeptide beta-N-acetylglucosaminyltransferase [Pseudomonadota bacterium]|jgi:UDP-N-acetylglucosamine--N-acetylmuramyl-(pentapeptide) pyrophosphoryl-undecaprenol N-acetylglucosamine transferase